MLLKAPDSLFNSTGRSREGDYTATLPRQVPTSAAGTAGVMSGVGGAGNGRDFYCFSASTDGGDGSYRGIRSQGTGYCDADELVGVGDGFDRPDCLEHIYESPVFERRRRAAAAGSSASDYFEDGLSDGQPAVYHELDVRTTSGGRTD